MLTILKQWFCKHHSITYDAVGDKWESVVCNDCDQALSVSAVNRRRNRWKRRHPGKGAL